MRLPSYRLAITFMSVSYTHLYDKGDIDIEIFHHLKRLHSGECEIRPAEHPADQIHRRIVPLHKLERHIWRRGQNREIDVYKRQVVRSATWGPKR